MPLSAPLAVAVEVSTSERRAFRLSRSVDDSAVTLERPAPFEIGEPVTVTFLLADDASIEPLVLRAVVSLSDLDGEGEHGGRTLAFRDAPREARAAIVRYVAGRLGLPNGSLWL